MYLYLCQIIVQQFLKRPRKHRGTTGIKRNPQPEEWSLKIKDPYIGLFTPFSTNECPPLQSWEVDGPRKSGFGGVRSLVTPRVASLKLRPYFFKNPFQPMGIQLLPNNNHQQNENFCFEKVVVKCVLNFQAAWFFYVVSRVFYVTSKAAVLLGKHDPQLQVLPVS